MHREEPDNQETKSLKKGLKLQWSQHRSMHARKMCKTRKRWRETKPDNQYPFSPFSVACVPFAFVSTFCCLLSQYRPAWENVTTWQVCSHYSNVINLRKKDIYIYFAKRKFHIKLKETVKWTMDVNRQVYRKPFGRQVTYQHSQYKQKVCRTFAYSKHLKNHQKFIIICMICYHKENSLQ